MDCLVLTLTPRVGGVRIVFTLEKAMFTANFGRRCVRLFWSIFVLTVVFADAEKLSAQSSDEWWTTRPATCPTYLYGGLSGWVFGYWHAGKSWTSEWNRSVVLNPVDYSDARYRPAAYDGYAAGKGNFIAANYWGNARWYKPAIDVDCEATDHFFMGRLIGVEERYRVYHHHGSVEECGGSSGPDGGPVDNEVYTDAAYDPYSPGSASADTGSGGSCSGDSGDGTWNPGAGDTYTCYTDLVVIEESYDGGETWHVVWQGYVTECY